MTAVSVITLLVFFFALYQPSKYISGGMLKMFPPNLLDICYLQSFAGWTATSKTSACFFSSFPMRLLVSCPP